MALKTLNPKRFLFLGYNNVSGEIRHLWPSLQHTHVLLSFFSYTLKLKNGHLSLTQGK